MGKGSAAYSRKDDQKMNDNYILMHKDVPCGVLAVDRSSGALSEFTLIDSKYAPFLGNANDDLMKIWWNHRAVPGSRRDMEEIVRRAGCESNTGYLAKNLALSLTDTYWICPADIELSWDDINLHKLSGASKNIVSYHNGTSYDPNASLGGQMSKYWDMSGNTPVLVKKAIEYYGQQGINELFATELHLRQNSDVSFASYSARAAEDNSILVCCDSFTSDRIEFVSAYEVLRSRKLRSSRSDYDHYLDICEEHGLDRNIMQHSMDYMILSDFAITNIDEHLQNFGLLRDSDTMELIGPAPIFDSGNSMFFSESGTRPLTRENILKITISSLHASEERMLRHIKNPAAVNAELLPSTEEVESFYIEHGLPEERAGFVAGSYGNKLSLLSDFQRGIKISLYLEKQRDKKHTDH